MSEYQKLLFQEASRALVARDEERRRLELGLPLEKNREYNTKQNQKGLDSLPLIKNTDVNK